MKADAPNALNAFWNALSNESRGLQIASRPTTATQNAVAESPETRKNNFQMTGFSM